MEKHIQHQRSYSWLAVELVIDFVIMYLVMYTMIATLDHFYLNLNNVYMTLMMVAPMAIVMLIAMRSMFPSRRVNLIVIASALTVFVFSLYGMRAQVAVDDSEFLRSMIPHHSGAILMCREASLTEPEIVGLCRDIIAAQNKEIVQMKAILERL
ncbi:MAG: DUF305 domain-containing protein [Gammaproteobacteria bacterium]|nr:DUF305 domain-containing protein [Gammaproteobacteria bacterium]